MIRNIELSDEERQWFEKNIPSDIVRKKAIEYYLSTSTRDLIKLLSEKKVYGYDKARRDGKRFLSYLAGIFDTKTASMTAVCDEIEDVGPIRSREDLHKKPLGKKCDIYINGLKIGYTSKLIGDKVRYSRKHKSMMGTIRDSEKVEIKTSDNQYRTKTFDRYSGDVLISDINIFSRKDIDLIGYGKIDVKNIVYSSDREFPCIDEKNGLIKCVNWVKLMNRTEARKVRLPI